MNGITSFADAHAALRTVSIVDEMVGFNAVTWNKTVTDSGTITVDADGVNGVVELLPSDVSEGDNDEAYMYSNEISKYLNGKPISIIAILQFAEVATNAANILFGIGEGFGAANTLQDNGGGPPADYDGICFFKADGGTRWNFESSLGTTQTTTALNYTAGGSEFQVIGMDLVPLNSTEMSAVPWISQAITTNGIAPVQAMPYDPQNSRPYPVKHRFSYATPGEMAVCFGAKNGTAAQQPLRVDLFVMQQNR